MLWLPAAAQMSEPAAPADAWLEASIESLQQAMAAGDVSSVELVEFYLRRIQQYDPDTTRGPGLNSIQHLNEEALAQARALDAERRQRGPRSLLHGIPLLVKDNYETTGMPTTAGSKLFEGYAPPRDAYLVERLRGAGAVVLGKTTMHEFAYGITTVGSLFGRTRNPYNPARNPGGSSGGTGAAVAANLAVAGMGSDTCGSIRIPAAHNNLVGLRGTQGLSSRRGIVPLSSTQDIGGPLARSVRDLAVVLDVTVGEDPADPQTAAAGGRIPDSYLAGLAPQPGARIGVLTDWMVQDDLDQPVADVVDTALRALADSAGWTVVEIRSPALNKSLDRAHNGHTVLVTDFADDINRYLAANPALGYADINALIEADLAHPDVQGSLHASANLAQGKRQLYEQELAQRRVVRAALQALLAEHQLQALAYPTIRRTAAPLGAEQPGTNCRLAANSGLPAISVPAGFTAEGMPVGLELLADEWQEQQLLNLALTVEHYYPQRRLPAATP